MLISDIPVGGPISIEISIDNVSYEMPSSVVASKNGYILIAPFTSKGAVIDFSSYKDILFNLYTIDPATKNRVVWKNINIETITYKSTGFASAYYKISTNVFASIASECDRRFNQRISTEALGHISSDTTEADIPVTLIDVSDKGLSFSTSNELLYNYNNTYITFSDQANGKQFNFHFKCFIIRSQLYGERYIYGCIIPTPSREYLTYVFLKKIEFRISSAKEQSEQTALKDAADVASQSIESTSSGYHSQDPDLPFASCAIAVITYFPETVGVHFTVSVAPTVAISPVSPVVSFFQE